MQLQRIARYRLQDVDSWSLPISVVVMRFHAARCPQRHHALTQLIVGSGLTRPSVSGVRVYLDHLLTRENAKRKVGFGTHSVIPANKTLRLPANFSLRFVRMVVGALSGASACLTTHR